MVVSRQLCMRMTGSEPAATMDDVYVLFGVLLCNMNSPGRHHLRPGLVQEPGPNEATAGVCLRAVAHSRDDRGGTTSLGEHHIPSIPHYNRLRTPPDPRLFNCQRPREPAIPDTPVVQDTRQEPRSNPTVKGQCEDVTSTAATTPQTWDVGTSMPTAIANQKVFVFLEFDPNWIRLVTRSIDPDTAVTCLLGFVELVCGADFQKVSVSARKDGLVLEQVKLNGAEVRQQFKDLLINFEP
ncbi:hypothetical protein MTO96_035956 [Rhipicephalus appendiculatus]